MSKRSVVINHGYELAPIDALRPHPRNPRKGDTVAIAESIAHNGFYGAVVAQRSTGCILAGNHRWRAAKDTGAETIPVIWIDCDDDEALRILLADNRTNDLAGYDDDALAALLGELRDAGGLDGTGYSEADVADLLGSVADAEALVEPRGEDRGSLSDRFLVPPFSVLDARQGYWLERKRWWLSLGIRSELGRGNDGDNTRNGLAFNSSSQPISVYKQKEAWEEVLGRKATWEEFYREHPDAAQLPGTSIFDPVLAELAYTWFCPRGGVVLDPFAGGSVRGVVAAAIGRRYVGIDLSERQIESNREQWEQILPRIATVSGDEAEERDWGIDELTPIERRGDVWIKRDDLFTVAGVSGGKVRSCWSLAQGAEGLVTAGSRGSPQVQIVAAIARRLGIPCRVHVPSGEISDDERIAVCYGAEIVQHKPGYASVIIARARADAEASGWREIPFGMECERAAELTAAQVRELPTGVQRIVVPVGSGMTLAGILRGLERLGRDIPVFGVCVGADAEKRLDRFAPHNWRSRCTLVRSGAEYGTPARVQEIEGVRLDPVYEAHCIPHLRAGDLFWVVGIRQTAKQRRSETVTGPRWIVGDSRQIDALCGDMEADLLFSCPPYHDLERYSDDPADLSNMPWEEFVAAYREIIARAAARLRDNRFAFWVVGEVRDDHGHYRDLIGHTVAAFRGAGLAYYGEAVYLTPLASLPVRVGRQFTTSRKFGKTHQNVLVFVKGDWRAAVAACGQVDVFVQDEINEEARVA